ncbi:VOC family protein [Streptomyces sp. NPDC020875]|uniref:VOC family protein n=1 Tax=Streptomyces sp. NPDC020875 TaxID=3154898 RepID=UPI0033F1AC76
MSARLDHTIVRSHDRFRGANFLAELIESPEPWKNGPFAALTLEDGLTLDYLDVEGEIVSQHLAFQVPDALFDTILGKIVERGLPYWADPRHLEPGRTYLLNGSRGFYLDDPDGHALEFLTPPGTTTGPA